MYPLRSRPSDRINYAIRRVPCGTLLLELFTGERRTSSCWERSWLDEGLRFVNPRREIMEKIWDNNFAVKSVGGKGREREWWVARTPDESETHLGSRIWISTQHHHGVHWIIVSVLVVQLPQIWIYRTKHHRWANSFLTVRITEAERKKSQGVRREMTCLLSHSDSQGGGKRS